MILFRSMKTGHKLLFVVFMLKSATAQFKILDASSFREQLQKNSRFDDLNATFVKINPLPITHPETITTTTSSFFTGSEPRAFHSTTNETVNVNKNDTDLNQPENKIKVLIETTSDISPAYRVGKLQETALKINYELLEPDVKIKYSSQIPQSKDKDAKDGQVIRIYTLDQQQSELNPIPSRNPIKRTIINNNEIPFNSVEKIINKKTTKNPFRKFKSRCRCEKISNCPRLQVSIARCPNDQFMCCF